METLTSSSASIVLGLSTALMPGNLLMCLMGVLMGMFVGVIPGVGSLAAIALLLPVTYHFEPTGALILLAGVYYGAAYGGSITSILLNIPGTPSSAAACLDGYPMATQGRAGAALMANVLAAFFGGSVGIILLILFSPIIVAFALKFGSAEYFSIIMLGLVAASAVSGTVIKAIAMAVLGMAFGAVGTDVYTGGPRLVFGVFELSDGVSLVALALGLFGISEIILSIRGASSARVVGGKITLRSMKPSRDDLRRSFFPAVRGSAIGSFFGALPGTGATISTFVAYAVERKLARDPSRFGRGAIEGVVAPEAANNASDQSAFIPTLTLGIPGTPTMAIILGALMIHGLTPGPALMVDKPDIFWGLVMSFWVGNLLLLIINIPLIGVWVKILSIPYPVMYPSVLMFICAGTYSVNLSTFEVLECPGFGAIGYVMRIFDFPAAPLLLGFILGPMLEEQFRRAMLLSGGDFMTFVETPISLFFLLATVFVLLWGLIGMARGRRIKPAKLNDI